MTMEINKMNSGGTQGVSPRTPPAIHKTIPPATALPGSEAPGSTDPVVTKTEEEYFATAFPSAAKEIRQHVLYQKTGIQQSPSLGSFIDRRA